MTLNSQAPESQAMLTAASGHFSDEGMGSGSDFGNWMRRTKKRRKMKKRKSIFGISQRNCSWTWRVKGHARM